MKLIFVGLGKFGFPIAENLINKGHDVFGLEIAGHNVIGCNELAELGGQRIKLEGNKNDLSKFDLMLLCLPYPEDFIEICIREVNRLPKSIVDFSTTSPERSVAIGDILQLKKVRYVDAPLSGSIADARKGNLTVFIGGNESSLLEQELQVIKEVGDKITFLDTLGKGSAAKLVNQYMHLNIMTIIGEALSIADLLHVDKRSVVKAMCNSSASSAMLKRFGKDIVNGDFTPNFSLKLANKDLNLVKKAIGEYSNSNLILNYSMELMQKRIEAGYENSNFSIICKRDTEYLIDHVKMTIDSFIKWSKFNGRLMMDSESGVSIFGYQTNDSLRKVTLEQSEDSASFYIVVQKGGILVEHDRQQIKARNFMVYNGDISFDMLPNTNIMIVETPFTAPSFTGEIPFRGNLKYIDGCHTSVLSPYIQGEPVLNALYMPPGIHQTMHVHPSMRCGIVLEGFAMAENRETHYDLSPGTIWYMPPFSNHKFRTDEDALNKLGLKSKNMEQFHLVAFHPESDDGINNKSHPMLNRTLVNGMSAKEIHSIHTL